MHFSVENQNGDPESHNDGDPAPMLKVFGVRSAEDKNTNLKDKSEKEQARKQMKEKQDSEKNGQQDPTKNGHQDPNGAGPSTSGPTGKA